MEFDVHNRWSEGSANKQQRVGIWFLPPDNGCLVSGNFDEEEAGDADRSAEEV